MTTLDVRPIHAAMRLSAVETLLDVIGFAVRSRKGDAEFLRLVNDRSELFRVGVRLEGKRFVTINSEHLYEEILRPTVLLLNDSRFAGVDDLYIKAFERVRGGDPAGAITAATSAVETMLRIGLNRSDGNLAKLCAQAQSMNWLTPAVAETAKKLYVLRSESDAHGPGTEQDELAMFALHIAGSVLLYLGDTFPR
jgi:hypothetical protein